MKQIRSKLIVSFAVSFFLGLTHLAGTAVEPFGTKVFFSASPGESSDDRKVNDCRSNPDRRYDRQKVLTIFGDLLYDALPERLKPLQKHGIKDERSIGFIVWDLTDATNKNLGQMEEPCVDFIDGHVYHFVDDRLPYSFSHIAVLEDGEIKVFKSLNCPEGKQDFESLVQYLKSKPRFNKNGLIQKVENFGHYQYLPPSDIRYFVCREPALFRPNPDKEYSRGRIYAEMEMILYRFAPESYQQSVGMSVVNQTQADPRALKFFVYDLSDPSNRQATSREQVDFIEGHIYHFGYLDAPYSYSHIGILESGTLKIFSGINCRNAKLNEVNKYVENKLSADPKRKDILTRLKNYRKYGVYLSNSRDTAVRCNELDNSTDNGVRPS